MGVIESASDAAFQIEQEVRDELTTVRGSWARLAALLYAFREQKAWELRSYGSFAEWLGQPEISLSRRHAYTLIQAWGDLVIDRGVDPTQLTVVDLSKLGAILPALRRGDVDVATALADCEHLSRSDLRAKYGQSGGAETEYHQCPECGHKHPIRFPSQEEQS